MFPSAAHLTQQTHTAIKHTTNTNLEAKQVKNMKNLHGGAEILISSSTEHLFFLSRPFSVWILREFLSGFDRVFHQSSGSAGFPWCWLWHSRNCVWWLRQPELKKNLSFSGSTPSSLSYDSNTITTFSSRADRTNLRSRLHLHLHLIAFIRRKGIRDKSRKPTLSPILFSAVISVHSSPSTVWIYLLLCSALSCRAGPSHGVSWDSEREETTFKLLG